MVRLRRVRLESPGWRRQRAGRGFVYLDVDRRRIAELEHLERIRALAIPPAWRDVWICPWPNGHIQAAGIDDAARRQYLYHQQWHARRARLKHEHVLEVARGLAAAGPPPASERARRRVVAAVVKDVSEELGNTPTVARASYIDPRVIDLWERGETIAPARSQQVAEKRTLALLTS